MSEHKKVNGVEINGKPLYVTPTGVKEGSKGKVSPVSSLYGTLTKGWARKVRKALRRMGEVTKAGAPRL